jgi:YggT family protein
MFLNVINLFFIIYTIMLFVKVIGSWFPNFQGSTIMRFVSHYTEPYLKIFRKLIPPIGGVIDLSPLLAFFSLKLIESFIQSFFK